MTIGSKKKFGKPLSVASPDEKLSPSLSQQWKFWKRKIVNLGNEDSTDVIEDLFKDDIDLDNSPDYLPDPEAPCHLILKGNHLLDKQQLAVPKINLLEPLRQLHLCQVGGPKLQFADDRKVHGHLEKRFVNWKTLLQNGSTTYGLHNHLLSKHPKVWMRRGLVDAHRIFESCASDFRILLSAFLFQHSK